MRLRRPTRIEWKWFDLWVGVYYDKFDRTLYVCPVPTLVLSWEFNR